MSDASAGNVRNWLDRLGYNGERGALHERVETVPNQHPYALEIRSLLKPHGAIQAKAVFDVEGVPTVVFVASEGGGEMTQTELDQIRTRIWNQNLASIVIEVSDEVARAFPVRKLRNVETMQFAEASPTGKFSANEVASPELARRLPKWFEAAARVDRKLLQNLKRMVDSLVLTWASAETNSGNQRKARKKSELIVGQILFISYLEHRNIVGDKYRASRQVGLLRDLIKERDANGVRLLIDALKDDFNGDFLGSDRHDPWSKLDEDAFSVLEEFISNTDIKTGQRSFWSYDFSFIPVELLSGIYEEFLEPIDQAQTGAYYTPRHLATLAVEQAFSLSDDPLSETIFDGACGSGILLTTAYRRLISLSEAKDRRQLTFYERGELLKRQIFGADINSMACRVTAFSLYLSLLEGLSPADISEAQKVDGAKLPPLKDINILSGSAGNFFNASHSFAHRRFSMLISNPPWSEPGGDSKEEADKWAEKTENKIARRQTAAAYTIRSVDFLDVGAIVCLILPISLLLGTTSQGFIKSILSRFEPRRIINFGDLQNLLFPTAEHACHVFLGKIRTQLDSIGLDQPTSASPLGEKFEYLVPKADLSLKLGRLTLASADKHEVLTRSAEEDHLALTTLMWGDASDIAIISRLTSRGRLRDQWSGPPAKRKWQQRKGIHLKDSSRESTSSAELQAIPHVPIDALRHGSLLLDERRLVSWPVNAPTVAGLTASVKQVFDGPRVVFPDGFSRDELNVRASYYEKPATFTHSIGVISGPIEDSGLLKFVTIYLRSNLARYLLMMTGWKMLCERNGVHLTDVADFPFWRPNKALDGDKARRAIADVEEFFLHLESLNSEEQKSFYTRRYSRLNVLVYNYFGISRAERKLIEETVRVLLPSIRPRGFLKLDTPAQGRANIAAVNIYARTLARALTLWRSRMGGVGTFTVSVVATDPEAHGSVGVVRVSYDSELTSDANVSLQISDQAARLAILHLKKNKLHIVSKGETLFLAPDTQIWLMENLYLVRPLLRRTWGIRAALQDAERIVRNVHSNSTRH